MHRTFVLAAALAVTACTDRLDTGQAVQPIVNGSAVAAGADLATVYLDLGGGSCSGTLITPKIVLTAEHCTSGTSPSSVWAMFGHIADDDGDWIQAVDILNHPSTDIALITLASAGPATPIPLYPDAFTDATMGAEVRIVGFGVTGENNSDSGRKRHGMTALHDFDGEVMYVGATGSKTCYGDSGGSAYMKKNGVDHIAGVISFGTDVCEAGLSGQMRVDVNLAWIEDYIAAHDPQPDPVDPPPDAGVPEPGDPDAGSDVGGPDAGDDPAADDPGVVTSGCAAGGGGGSALLALLLLLGRPRRR